MKLMDKIKKIFGGIPKSPKMGKDEYWEWEQYYSNKEERSKKKRREAHK